MHLAKLILENVQSHEKSEFDLLPGLNILTGSSDVGKTVVIRALRSLFYLGGSSKSLTRYAEPFFRVTALMNTGVTVIQERGTTANREIVRQPGQKGGKKGEKEEGLVLSGFRFDIPVEVSKALGVKKTSINVDDAQELNLAEQIRGPFILSKPGTAKAQFVGSLTHLDDIDDAVRDLNKDITLTNREIKELEIKKIDFETKLTEFANLERLEAEFTSLDQLSREIESSQFRISVLQDLKQKYAQLYERFMTTKRVLDVLVQMPDDQMFESEVVLLSRRVIQLELLKSRDESLRIKWAQAQTAIERLKEIPEILEVERVSRRIESLQSLKSRTQDLVSRAQMTQLISERLEKIPEVDSTVSIQERIRVLEQLAQSTKALFDRRSRVERELEEYSQQILELESELTKAKKERVEEYRVQRVCPTCKTLMTEEKILQLVEDETEST